MQHTRLVVHDAERQCETDDRYAVASVVEAYPPVLSESIKKLKIIMSSNKKHKCVCDVCHIQFRSKEKLKVRCPEHNKK